MYIVVSLWLVLCFLMMWVIRLIDFMLWCGKLISIMCWVLFGLVCSMFSSFLVLL